MEVGRLTAEAYVGDGLMDAEDGYVEQLVDAARRAREAEVWVAVEGDRVLGTVLEQADGSFNTLLEMGFASAIRKEHAWRTSRGESTRNLEAFRGWLETDVADEPGED